MIAALGLAALAMGALMLFVDPVSTPLSPVGVGLVWIAFALACFAIAWSRRNWRPPPE